MVVQEGYLALVPPYRGILLRHASPDMPDWYVSAAGMTAAVSANLIKAGAYPSTGHRPRSAQRLEPQDVLQPRI